MVAAINAIINTILGIKFTPVSPSSQGHIIIIIIIIIITNFKIF